MKLLNCNETLAEITKIYKEAVLKNTTPITTEENLIRHFDAVNDYKALQSLFEEKLNSERNPEKVVNELKAILSERWERIKTLDTAYPYDLANPANQVYVFIAKKLAEILDVSFYLLLMPTIVYDPEENLGTNKNWQDLQLHEFILSDDSKRIIEIFPVLDAARRDGILRYYRENTTHILSPTEKAYLLKHSLQVQKCYGLIQQLLIEQAKPSPGKMLQALRNALLEGSVASQGEEKNAASPANEGIFEFSEYMKSLSSNEQAVILNCRNQRDESFRDSWKLLTRTGENKEDYTNVEFCVKSMSDSIDLILDANQWLYVKDASVLNTAIDTALTQLEQGMNQNFQRTRPQLAPIAYYDTVWTHLIQVYPNLLKQANIYLHLLTESRFQIFFSKLTLAERLPFIVIDSPISKRLFEEIPWQTSELLNLFNNLPELLTLNVLPAYLKAFGNSISEFLGKINNSALLTILLNTAARTAILTQLPQDKCKSFVKRVVAMHGRITPDYFLYPEIGKYLIKQLDIHTLFNLTAAHYQNIITNDAAIIRLIEYPHIDDLLTLLKILNAFPDNLLAKLIENDSVMARCGARFTQPTISTWLVTCSEPILLSALLVNKGVCEFFLKNHRMEDIKLEFNTLFFQKIASYQLVPAFLTFLDKQLYPWLKKASGTTIKTLLQDPLAVQMLVHNLTPEQIGDFIKSHPESDEVQSFAFNDKVIAVVALDNNIIVAADANDIKVIDNKTYTLIASFSASQKKVRQLLVLNQHQFISSGEDGSVKVWDIRKNEFILKIQAHDRPVDFIGITQNNLLFTAAKHIFSFWDLDSGALLNSQQLHDVLTYILGIDAQSNVIIADSKHTIGFVNPQTCTLVKKRYTGHKAKILSVMVLENGTILSSATDTVAIWHPDSGQIIATYAFNECIHQLVSGPNSQILGVTSKGRLYAWQNISAGKQPTTVSFEANVTCLEGSPSGLAHYGISNQVHTRGYRLSYAALIEEFLRQNPRTQDIPQSLIVTLIEAGEFEVFLRKVPAAAMMTILFKQLSKECMQQIVHGELFRKAITEIYNLADLHELFALCPAEVRYQLMLKNPKICLAYLQSEKLQNTEFFTKELIDFIIEQNQLNDLLKHLNDSLMGWFISMKIEDALTILDKKITIDYLTTNLSHKKLSILIDKIALIKHNKPLAKKLFQIMLASRIPLAPINNEFWSLVLQLEALTDLCQKLTHPELVNLMKVHIVEISKTELFKTLIINQLNDKNILAIMSNQPAKIACDLALKNQRFCENYLRSKKIVDMPNDLFIGLLTSPQIKNLVEELPSSELIDKLFSVLNVDQLNTLLKLPAFLDAVVDRYSDDQLKDLLLRCSATQKMPILLEHYRFLQVYLKNCRTVDLKFFSNELISTIINKKLLPDFLIHIQPATYTWLTEQTVEKVQEICKQPATLPYFAQNVPFKKTVDLISTYDLVTQAPDSVRTWVNSILGSEPSVKLEENFLIILSHLNMLSNLLLSGARAQLLQLIALDHQFGTFILTLPGMNAILGPSLNDEEILSICTQATPSRVMELIGLHAQICKVYLQSNLVIEPKFFNDLVISKIQQFKLIPALFGFLKYELNAWLLTKQPAVVITMMSDPLAFATIQFYYNSQGMLTLMQYLFHAANANEKALLSQLVRHDFTSRIVPNIDTQNAHLIISLLLLSETVDELWKNDVVLNKVFASLDNSQIATFAHVVANSALAIRKISLGFLNTATIARTQLTPPSLFNLIVDSGFLSMFLDKLGDKASEYITSLPKTTIDKLFTNKAHVTTIETAIGPTAMGALKEDLFPSFFRKMGSLFNSKRIMVLPNPQEDKLTNLTWTQTSQNSTN